MVSEKTLKIPLGNQTSQSKRKIAVLNIHWKDWCWSWSSNTLVTSSKELTHLKRPWCWQRLKAREVNDRGWDGWMASLIQWTWVWANSGSWWWTGKLGTLPPWGHNWVTELNRSDSGWWVHHNFLYLFEVFHVKTSEFTTNASQGSQEVSCNLDP